MTRIKVRGWTELAHGGNRADEFTGELCAHEVRDLVALRGNDDITRWVIAEGTPPGATYDLSRFVGGAEAAQALDEAIEGVVAACEQQSDDPRVLRILAHADQTRAELRDMLRNVSGEDKAILIRQCASGDLAAFDERDALLVGLLAIVAIFDLSERGEEP